MRVYNYTVHVCIYSHDVNIGLRLGLWYVTPLSTLFHSYRDGQFYWWRKPEYPEKTRPTTSHWQTLSHNGVSSTPRHELDSNSQL